MNDRVSNKANSFSATIEVMLRNEPIWKTSANATKQFSAIQLKMPLITTYDQNQNKGPSISISVKKGLKDDLIKMALKISDSAVDYASGIDDLALELSVTLTDSQLRKLRQNELYDSVDKFYKVVNPLKSSFTHLEETDMDTFHSLLLEYQKAVPKTEADNDSSKTATQNIGEIIRELNRMFIKLDKHIKPYSHSNPDFYSDYKNSRSVKDLRGRGKSTKTKKNKNEDGESKTA
jgi:hypothetical protein